jgi:predicted RNase H-like nuclease (RuvC/YqgF family)
LEDIIIKTSESNNENQVKMLKIENKNLKRKLERRDNQLQILKTAFSLKDDNISKEVETKLQIEQLYKSVTGLNSSLTLKTFSIIYCLKLVIF